MASIKVFPKMNKINKYGQVPIYLRLTKNRRSRYIALDVYIDPKDWNEKSRKLDRVLSTLNRSTASYQLKRLKRKRRPLKWKAGQIL